MVRAICFVSVVAALMVALGGVARPDGNTGTVRGIVRSPDGRPVCGLMVTAESNREGEWVVRTNPDGTYLFLALFPGDVDITFLSREPVERRTWVSPNLNSVVNVTVPSSERRLGCRS